jgi:hypothetical protein
VIMPNASQVAKTARPTESDRSQDFDDLGLDRSIIVKPPDQDGPVDKRGHRKQDGSRDG